MKKPLAEFRRLAQHNRSGKGQGRYPARAKELALAYMADRRAKGDSMASVAKALGVANQTLMDWRNEKTSRAEEIESIARCFIRVKHKRLKYRCRCGGCIETALGPNKLIGGGRYATSVAVGVAVDKYADHLPLERQAKIMTRQGLTIDSQTLWDQIEALGRHLQPAYERLHEYVLTKSVVGAERLFCKAPLQANQLHF